MNRTETEPQSAPKPLTVEEQTILELKLQLEAHWGEGFHITDENSANWVLKKFADAVNQLENAKAFAASEKHRAECEIEYLKLRFQKELQTYAASTLRVKGGKAKTLKLPAGTLGFRTVGIHIEVLDGEEDNLIDWALDELPEAVTAKVNISGLSATQLDDLKKYFYENKISADVDLGYSKAVLNKSFDEDKIIPEGCEVVDEHEEFSASPFVVKRKYDPETGETNSTSKKEKV